MKIAIASIQRNRNPYIIEWIAFHLAMGFNQFYIYCHKTTDGMTEKLLQLGKRYPIHVFALEEDDFPQIHAYQHAWTNFGKAVDWMAFIDGDEFLFPTQTSSIQDALAPYNDKPLSALGVYWKCYGSNGHVADPSGLVLENYPRHSQSDFSPNRHIKSIVKGGADANPNRSHMFETALGTFDERMRPITHGCMLDYEPTYDHFRINHYVVQSRDFFFKIKQGMGAADLPQGVRRQDEFFANHDHNEEDDGVARALLPRLKDKVSELTHYLTTEKSPPSPAAGVRAIVQDYHLVQTIPPGEYRFAGNSVGLKEIVGHIFPNPARNVSLLDIGFGLGDLGRIVKTNPALQHWQVDGIDGFWDACCNTELFSQGHYRNIWHGLAQDLPMESLQAYDLICLFDVIEHLEPAPAKQLLTDLLNSLGPESKLVLSTPLWFWPQAHQNSDDLEEHKIGIPGQSLLLLSPRMYHIHAQFLVGTFVFGKESLEHIDNFVPTTDRNFNMTAGLQHLHTLGVKADGVLYIAP
ncbi:glycosyltransferase family 92 protein [Rhodoferax saidenbachensis]|uniref:glycosyltransferase family 92 protein n=1 Tax=Rhodoferax saidenbachensis TaxID=1484693 RepID=UPI0012EB8150|nr:glycosyltransferase family 2 protein [Rhodoferax saidenbachensis]